MDINDITVQKMSLGLAHSKAGHKSGYHGFPTWYPGIPDKHTTILN